MSFLIISFIAGFLTILAPCILPVLPIIIGGSISDGENKNKSYVIILSLIISIVMFTLLLKVSTVFINIPQNVWSYISGGILILFSIMMLFPTIWDSLFFVSKMRIGSNKVLGANFKKKSFFGDVLVGMALGPVFSSCSPTYFLILATVLPVSLSLGVVYLFVYAIGLGIALLLISLLGQKIVSKLEGVSDPNGWFKKLLGLLFLIVGLFIITGTDKIIQTKLLESGYFDITKVENKILEKEIDSKNTDNPIKESITTGTDVNLDKEVKTTKQVSLIDITKKKILYPKYTEIVNPSGFVNTNNLPIKIGDYIGKKVIIVDFMTYSCINCKRTFPYLKTWYEKYEKDGLIIIGIHTPEFAFEHKKENVETAMKENGLNFPIVLDNDYGTWSAYKNSYWPRKYIIDIDGYVVYDHIGEGKYEETEDKIVELLNERKIRLNEEKVLNTKSASAIKNSYNNLLGSISPETYIGSARSMLEYKGNGVLPIDNYKLSGDWLKTKESSELTSDSGSIFYHFNAGKVYLVAESAIPNVAEVYLDGNFVNKITFKDSTLYDILDLKENTGEHNLEIRFSQKGVKAYAFTFGL